MAALGDLVDAEWVRNLLQDQNYTMEELAKLLQENFPGVRGCSLRNVQRFCQEHNIKKRTNISDEQLDNVVAEAVAEVGGLVFIYIKIIQLFIYRLFYLAMCASVTD